jgi:hypothetical protein
VNAFIHTWAPLLQSLLGSDVVCDHLGLSGFTTTQQMLDTADELQSVTDVVPVSSPRMGYIITLEHIYRTDPAPIWL